jgi:hypothetical protein
VPISDIGALFDHLVGAGEQRWTKFSVSSSVLRDHKIRSKLHFSTL